MPFLAGGGEPAERRKRSFGRLDGGLAGKSNPHLSALIEEDEEEGDAVEGPTPQRRRRDRESATVAHSHTVLTCMQPYPVVNHSIVPCGHVEYAAGNAFRPAGSSIPSDDVFSEGDEDEEGSVRQGLDRIMALLPSQVRCSAMCGPDQYSSLRAE